MFCYGLMETRIATLHQSCLDIYGTIVDADIYRAGSIIPRILPQPIFFVIKTCLVSENKN